MNANEQNAVNACALLCEAYQRGADSGSIDWQDVDLAYEVAGEVDVKEAWEVPFNNPALAERQRDALAARLVEAVEELKGCADVLTESAKQHRERGDGSGHGQTCGNHAANARLVIERAERTDEI